MTAVLPSLSQWNDLTPSDVEILHSGSDEQGRWTTHHHIVLRFHRVWTIIADLLPDGELRLRQGMLRLHEDGFRWDGSQVIGYLQLAPEDSAWQEEQNIWNTVCGPMVTVRRQPPYAPTAEDRRDIVLRALSYAIGPEARRRIEAIIALARVRLMVAGSRSGIVKPLGKRPRILIHQPKRTTSTQALFRRLDGGSCPPPNLHAILHHGACRQVRLDCGTEILSPCDQIRVSVPQDIVSRQALLASIEQVIAQFDALGTDIRPWIIRRT